MMTTPHHLALCMLIAIGSMPAHATMPSLADVEPYTAEFDYFVSSDTESNVKAGSWTDLVTIADGQLSRTVTRYTNERVADLKRTVIVEQDTIAPVRIQQRFGLELSSVYQIDFDGQSLSQVLIGTPDQPARTSTAKLTTPVVETGLHAVFALSLPLREATEITVDAYTAGAAPQVTPSTFHVVGQEQVEAMGRTLQTWRVEDRAKQWTYWVRSEKPYIVKVSHPLPGGSMATSIVTRFD